MASVNVGLGQETSTGVRGFNAANDRADNKRSSAYGKAKQYVKNKYGNKSSDFQKKMIDERMAKYDNQVKSENARKESQGVPVYGSAGSQNSIKGNIKVNTQAGHEKAKQQRRQRIGQWQKDSQGYQRSIEDFVDSKRNSMKDKEGNTHSYFEKEDMQAIQALRQNQKKGKEEFLNSGKQWDPSDMFKQYNIQTPGTYGSYGSKGQ